MDKARRILMIAAENDALPGGKVGGIGDVVRDVPRALAEQGCQVDVVIPSYYSLARLKGATKVSRIRLKFRGVNQDADLYRVPARTSKAGVTHWVIDHPALSPCGEGNVYCDDGADRPFATDASKYALFCAAVAELVKNKQFGSLDVVHLHDWHAAMFLVLRRYHPDMKELQQYKCVYTIHNLALQGIRPFAADMSSLQSWFPGLASDNEIVDPRWPDCINLMRAGIRLGDKVHAVSPTYAKEILKPSNVDEQGYFGGEGLETDLQEAQKQGRLLGILNGCEYPSEMAKPRLKQKPLAGLLHRELLKWVSSTEHVPSVHFIAERRLSRLASANKHILITSVGRVTDQKVRLLQQPLTDGRTALAGLLDLLGNKGTFLCVGSGDKDYEQFLLETSAHYKNFIFLRGYSEAIAKALYTSGDLFLMPSSFEPCGISQMLAMRAGQPCLVHRVGGLSDTVEHGRNGFTFSGSSPIVQAQQMLSTFESALDVIANKPEQWQAMQDAAAQARFTWKSSIDRYLAELYDN